MPTTPLQVLIVGDQPLPNLIAALDPALQTKAVVMLHTPDYKPRALYLAKVLEKYHIKTLLFPMVSAFDPEAIQQGLGELATALKQHFPNQTPTLNFTIGTKLQAVLCTQFAQANGWQVVYVNNHDQLLWLNPQQPPHNLANRMTIEDALLANGYRVIRKQPLPQIPAYTQVTHQIIERLEVFEKALRQLNYLAFISHPKRPSKLPTEPDEAFRELLTLFQKAGFLTIKGQQIQFTNEEARFFANGGWLEVHLASTIRQLAQQLPDLQDHAMGLEVENIRTKVKNELDNVILFNNTLHIIECKTKYFKQGGNHPDGTQAIYKLDTLGDFIGGAFARAMLATIYPLKQADERRAAQYGIRLVQDQEIKNLKETLSQWLSIAKT